MKIRNQFIISMILFGVIIAVVSTLVFDAYHRVQKIDEQEDLARNIIESTGQLSYLSNDYLLYHQNQQKTRWETQFTSLSDDVAKLKGNNSAQQALVKNIAANQQRLQAVFSDVVLAVESAPQNQSSVNSLDFVGVSNSRMEVLSLGITSDASQLSRMLRSELADARTLDIWLIIGLIAAIVVYFLVNSFIIFRRTLKSVSQLQAGARTIGAGNLDFVIEHTSKDEIGDLSRAFNSMTINLKAVTASKADLEKEMEERRRAERKLAEQAAMLHSVNDAVVGFDTNYLITYWNPAAEQIYGYTARESLGKFGFDHLSPRHTDTTRQEMIDRIAKVGHGEFVSIRRTRDGRDVFIDSHVIALRGVDGQVTGYVAVDRDVTERRKTEEKMAHLASFPALNPDPVVEMEASGEVVYLNAAAERLFPDLRALGSKHPFLADWSTLVNDVGSAGRFPLPRDILVGDRWYMQTVTHVPLTGTFRAYSRDITARKQAEQDLKQRTVELEASNKELETFSYSVSHDLRAPLRIMDGFSKALLEDYCDKLDEQGKKWLTEVRASSQKMAELIDDLLGLSRVVRADLKIQNLDLSAMARSTCEGLEGAYPERRVEWIIAANIQARGDLNLLRLVLDNLLGNAFKFTVNCEKARIEFGVVERDGHRACFVRDNGAGFDMEYVRKLFQPFQRLHSYNEFAGTGIGLATVQRIIRRHGGEVWAEGAVGKGATFYFTLGYEG